MWPRTIPGGARRGWSSGLRRQGSTEDRPSDPCGSNVGRTDLSVGWQRETEAVGVKAEHVLECWVPLGCLIDTDPVATLAATNGSKCRKCYNERRKARKAAKKDAKKLKSSEGLVLSLAMQRASSLLKGKVRLQMRWCTGAAVRCQDCAACSRKTAHC